MHPVALKICHIFKRTGLLNSGFSAIRCLDRLGASPESGIDAFEKLEAIFPDRGGSCVAENIVDEDPAYDVQVIMPVYNTEATLRQAIESVLHQSGQQKILLTIVNDGSPDNSAEILKEYSGIENIEIIAQDNKGFSGARNAALRHLKARYVTFLDSDDWLPDDAISALYSTAAEGGYDIVQGSFTYVYPDGSQKDFPLPTIKGNGRLLGFACGKLIRAELFRHIRFPERYWFEDTIMSAVIFPMTNPCLTASISTPVYFYRDNPKGISRTAGRQLKVIDTIYVTRRVYEDRAAIGLPLRRDEYDAFLNQAVINLRRVNSYGDKNLTRLAFLAMKELREKHFYDARPSSRNLCLLHNALRGARVSLFLLAIDLM